MSITPTEGSIFGRRKSKAPATRTGSFNFPLQDPDERVFELASFSMFKDENYGKEQYGNMKLKATFVLLAPGDANDPADQDEMRALAHGKWFSLEMHPSATPPGVNPRSGESYRASQLFELIRHLANYGRRPDPFTQLGIIDEDVPEQMEALRVWTKEYNKNKDAEDRITDISEGMARYAAATVTKLLNELESAQPRIQVKGSIDIKVSGQGNEYNKLTGITARLREKDMLPAFVRLPQPVDPRTADDDPSIICDECGQPTHGYLRRTDQVWVGNAEAAEMSKKSNGGLVVCGKCIWEHSSTNPENHGKQKPFAANANKPAVERAASKPAEAKFKASLAAKAAVRNVPVAAEDDDDLELPF